jgi:mRNA-degrading endonuclease YafQ of YafQ-DinJ toxin-antitoxin module
MKNKHHIRYSGYFRGSYTKVTKGNKEIKKRVAKVIDLLQEDPFYPSLKTHKVNTRIHGVRYSSMVTGDIRLIWDFDTDDRVRIIVINIGGHSGKNKVYL